MALLGGYRQWLDSRERFIGRRTRRKRQDVKYHFVLSTGRTGTELLHRCFREMGLNSYHEPVTDALDIAVRRWRDNVADEVTLSRYIYARRRNIGRVGRGGSYFETNNNLSLIADVIDQLAHVKIVHIVRDPYTWLISALNMTAGKKDDGQFFLSTLDVRRRLLPCDLKMPFQEKLFGEVISPVDWVQKCRLEQLCLYYIMVNKMIENLVDCPRVRMEELYASSEAAVKVFTEALGIDKEHFIYHFALVSEKRVNATPRLFVSDIDELTIQDRSIVEKWLGPVRHRYGYKGEG